MTFELFSPHGSNPLGNLRVANSRCAKVEFDRTVRHNILIMDGDVTQSKISLPKDGDRPLSSLQLPYPLLCFQVFCPSSGQCSFEINVSHNAMTRMKMTSATFTSRADVVDAKGMPHIKLPLAIPRNMWTQVVFHLPGVVTNLFNLPQVKSIDSVSVSGSVRIRRIFACQEESAALEKPQGMLLFTVPAFGPPIWKAAPAPTSPTGAKQQQQQQTGTNGQQQDALRSPTTTTTKQSDAQSSTPPPQPVRNNTTAVSLEQVPQASASNQQQQQQQPRASSSPSMNSSSTPVSRTPPREEPINGNGGASGGFRVRFARGDDGRVTFSANDPEAPPAPPELSPTEAWVNKVRADAEEKKRLQQEEDLSYARLVSAEPAPSSNMTRTGIPRARPRSPTSPSTPPSAAAANALPSMCTAAPKGPDFNLGETCDGWGANDDDLPSSLMMPSTGVGSSNVANNKANTPPPNFKVGNVNAGGGGGPMRTGGGGMGRDAGGNVRQSTNTRLPNLPQRGASKNPASPQNKESSAAAMKNVQLGGSVVVLSKLADRQLSEVHPADDVRLPVSRKEREVGYGIGDLEILRTRESSDDEDDDDDDDDDDDESTDSDDV